MYKGILKHITRAQLDKQVPRHIISQISHDHSSPSGFLYRATVDLKEVQIAINVHHAILIIQNARRRQYLTILSREMEERFEFVDVGALHEVGRVEGHLEPARHGQVLVTVDAVVRLLVDGHMHIESRRIEVKHDGLLFEAEAGEGTGDHFVDIVVEGLLDVDCR